MNLIVRLANDLDADAADQLTQRAFAELRTIYRPKDNAPRAGSQHLTRVVAELDGRIVGTLQYSTEADRLHIRGVAVDAGYRRQGISGALIEHVAGIARRDNLAVISLYTIQETGNAAIFERLGFVPINSEPARWAISASIGQLIELLLEKRM